MNHYPIYIDPTVIASYYIAHSSKPITEQEVMRGVHDVTCCLDSSHIVVIGVEESTPDIPYWNPDVTVGLNRLNNINVVEIKKTLSNDMTFRKGKNMKDYQKRISKVFGKDFHKNIVDLIKNCK